jgi:hypothetical protein
MSSRTTASDRPFVPAVTPDDIGRIRRWLSAHPPRLDENPWTRKLRAAYCARLDAFRAEHPNL